MDTEFKTKIKLLVKSEKAMIDLEIRKKAKQTVWTALALIVLLIGLIALNFTLYFYLSQTFSQVASSAILTLINFINAGIFFWVASKQTTGSEAQTIEEIRDFAWKQVSSDVDEAKESVAEFKQKIVNIKSNIDSFRNDSFGFKNLVPIVTTLIDLNKKK
ncbi:MAG: hypothetical protein DSZ08_05610 [Sulfurovum sp.]|nr:MAG: hypothetical protein DSZ08_05610 [Sulfurovum sp.]